MNYLLLDGPLAIVCSAIATLGFLAKGSFVGTIGTIGTLFLFIVLAFLTPYQKDIIDFFTKKFTNTPAEASKSYALIVSRFQRQDAKFDVTCLSALNYDSIYRVAAIEPDREFVAGEHAHFAGGSGANTGYILATHGKRVSVLGVVGEDELGKRMLKELGDAKIDVSLVDSVGGNSGRTAIISDARGQRLIVVDPGANLQIATIFRGDRVADIGTRIAASRVFHISSFAQHTSLIKPMQQVFSKLSDDIAVSYVPGDIQSTHGLDDPYNGMIFRRADCIFIYEKHLENLLSSTTSIPDVSSKSLKDRVNVLINWRLQTAKLRPFLLCVKKNIGVSDPSYVNYLSVFLCGYDVLKVIRPNNRSPDKTPKIYDSTGAGDAAAAGVIAGLLDGLDLEEVAHRALQNSLDIASSLGPRGKGRKVTDAIGDN